METRLYDPLPLTDSLEKYSFNFEPGQRVREHDGREGTVEVVSPTRNTATVKLASGHLIDCRVGELTPSDFPAADPKLNRLDPYGGIGGFYKASAGSPEWIIGRTVKTSDGKVGKLVKVNNNGVATIDFGDGTSVMCVKGMYSITGE
jgi:hypothetical protein